MKRATMIFFIGMTLFLGLSLSFSPYSLNLTDLWKTIFTNIGSALIATSLVSLYLDLFWSRFRSAEEKRDFGQIMRQWESFYERLNNLERRLEAFKQLGLNYCHKDRDDALKRFYKYAEKKFCGSRNEKECQNHIGTIDIVSSSARGLMGYLDRETSDIQKKWCFLITQYPMHFRFLLTHPAYAHLRQPAEERESGDIEIEILKTAIYLHTVCGMQSENLRFYRGSPTVFLIQIDNHILLNPYPYGKMAMDTLSLEFESDKTDEKQNYVAEFTSKHFNHTWDFLKQPSRRVEDKQIVSGVQKFDNILEAFGECTFLGEPKSLRFSKPQVEELDFFTSKFLMEKEGVEMKKDNGIESHKPFEAYCDKNHLIYNERKQQNLEKIVPPK